MAIFCDCSHKDQDRLQKLAVGGNLSEDENALCSMQAFIKDLDDKTVSEKTGIPLQTIQRVRGSGNGSI